jgi:hypothetical protein
MGWFGQAAALEVSAAAPGGRAATTQHPAQPRPNPGTAPGTAANSPRPGPDNPRRLPPRSRCRCTR